MYFGRRGSSGGSDLNRRRQARSSHAGEWVEHGDEDLGAAALERGRPAPENRTHQDRIEGEPEGGAKLPGLGCSPSLCASRPVVYRFFLLGPDGLVGPEIALRLSSSRNEKQPPGFPPPVSMKCTLPSTFG